MESVNKDGLEKLRKPFPAEIKEGNVEQHVGALNEKPSGESMDIVPNICDVVYVSKEEQENPLEMPSASILDGPVCGENNGNKNKQGEIEIIAPTVAINETLDNTSVDLKNNTDQEGWESLVTSTVEYVLETSNEENNTPIEAEVVSEIMEDDTIDDKREYENVVDTIYAAPYCSAAPDTPVVLENVLLNPAPSTECAVKQATEVSVGQPATGLGLLAQYASDNESDSDERETKDKTMHITDSDEDDVVEVPTATTPANHYRNEVVKIASDSSSDGTDNDSDSDVEYLATIRKAIDKRIQNVDDDDDDDDDDEDGGDGKSKKRRPPPKVMGEKSIDELPPIQDLHITVPEEDCVELGKVHSIVDQLVLVSAVKDSVLLNLDTVLFLEKGQLVLGEVFDVLGQVADPLYCVRFNSKEQIVDKGIKIGDIVYCAPKTEYTQFVILSSLMQLRGSDASWEHDVEPPQRYLDYSDDEEERDARARMRNKNRPYEHNDPTKRPRSDDLDQSTSTKTASFNQRGPPYRPQHHQHSHNGLPQDYRPPNNHGGSWHSNYHHQRYRAGGPPQHYHQQHQLHQPPNYRMPPQYQQNHHAYSPMYGRPPPEFHSATPPPMHYMQQVPPPLYAPNPYNIRQPVLASPQQHTAYSPGPPPPPPGSM